MSCCSSCSSGGPCGGDSPRAMAPVAQYCPGCGYRDDGHAHCGHCGFDLGRYWDTQEFPSEFPLNSVATDSFKGGSLPAVDQYAYHLTTRYPPASLIGPCVRRYPDSAYWPRLPYQVRNFHRLQQQGPDRPLRYAHGMSKREFGLMRKRGLIR
jgi:hypothetical protein